MSTPNNDEVLREIVSNAIYRKSFNLLIQNEQLNVLDWSGKVMDVFTRQCEEMRRDAVKTSGAINEKHIEAMIQIQHKNTEIAQLTAELATANKELERVKAINIEAVLAELDKLELTEEEITQYVQQGLFEARVDRQPECTCADGDSFRCPVYDFNDAEEKYIRDLVQKLITAQRAKREEK